MRSTLLRRASLGTAVAALGVGLTVLSAHPAAAQTTVYSNTTTFLASGYNPGGATSATGSTLMDADDLTLAPGSAGLAVSGFTFSLANFNTVTAAAAPTVSFYSTNAANTGPGALLAAFTFTPISLASNNVGLFNYNPTTNGLFNLPKGTLWAGMSFSNGSTGTATVAQLNNFGQGLFDAPTVGSSTDGFFETNNPSTTASNPAGSFYPAPFTGAVANFGWSIRTVNPPAVPEASTTVSLGLMLALGMGGLVIASKRKKASVKA